MNPSYLLSVFIPTYNRRNYLTECLNSVLPQIKGKEDVVEVIVSDNASVDDTTAVVKEFQQSYPTLKYSRNEVNLGYVGNQLKFFELSNGKYIAFLSDDDAYLPGMIDALLGIIRSGKEYSLIALNYISFYKNYSRPVRKNFVEAVDKTFTRAYDIMKYPTVGHFSGLVFNAAYAKPEVEVIFKKHPLAYFENMRGMLSEVALYTTKNAGLPSFFLGERLLANRLPKTVDYNMLKHLCLDYYEYCFRQFQEKLIGEDDLKHRQNEVLNILPRAVIANSYKYSATELAEISGKFEIYFKNNERYKKKVAPLFHLAKYLPFKILYKISHQSFVFFKHLSWELKSGS